MKKRLVLNNDPETYVEYTLVGQETFTRVRSGELGTLNERTASDDLAFSRRLLVLLIVRIRHVVGAGPLADIAVHIKKSPGVAFKTRYRNGLGAVQLRVTVFIRVGTVVVCLLGRNVFPCVKGRCRSGSCSVLPLCFSGQSIAVGSAVPTDFHLDVFFVDCVGFSEAFAFT